MDPDDLLPLHARLFHGMDPTDVEGEREGRCEHVEQLNGEDDTNASMLVVRGCCVAACSRHAFCSSTSSPALRTRRIVSLTRLEYAPSRVPRALLENGWISQEEYIRRWGADDGELKDDKRILLYGNWGRCAALLVRDKVYEHQIEKDLVVSLKL